MAMAAGDGPVADNRVVPGRTGSRQLCLSEKRRAGQSKAKQSKIKVSRAGRHWAHPGSSASVVFSGQIAVLRRSDGEHLEKTPPVLGSDL